jgi:hypothetical protein
MPEILFPTYAPGFTVLPGNIQGSSRHRHEGRLDEIPKTQPIPGMVKKLLDDLRKRRRKFSVMQGFIYHAGFACKKNHDAAAHHIK